MAKDLYHDAVEVALMKDGWTIIKDEYRLNVDDDFLFLIDVYAEKYVVAERKNQLIFVEIKSFASAKKYEFHGAIGQYITYHTALEYLKLEYDLYLAVPIDVFNQIFKTAFAQYLTEKYKIKLMPFNPIKKILVK